LIAKSFEAKEGDKVELSSKELLTRGTAKLSSSANATISPDNLHAGGLTAYT